MISFDLRIIEFYNLSVKKFNLEHEKSTYLILKDYNASALVRAQIKPIEHEIKKLLQSIKNEIKNLIISSDNLYEYQIRYMFLQQFRAVDTNLAEKINAQIKILQNEKQKHLQAYNFKMAELTNQKIIKLKSLAKKNVANYFNIYL